MKHIPISFDTYLQGIDFSKITPTLRVSFDLYRAASDRYHDQHQASVSQSNTASNERLQTLKERPKSDALALLQDIIEEGASQDKAREDYKREQQLARVEFDRLAKAYTQSSDRLVHVYKGLQERGELTRQDKRLFDALCNHNIARFREDQQRLTMTLDQVLSPLS